MKSFIIIPVYNEENTIVEIVSQIKELAFDKKIIVVDDASEDKSYGKVSQAFPDVILLRHKINLGKGAALKTGCQAALQLGNNMDNIVFIDADGQHSPLDIPKIIEKLQKEKLDIVFGIREINRGKMPLLKYFGNKFLSRAIKFFSKVSLDDTQTGFKAFIYQVYPKIVWQSQDYSVDTEIILNVGKHNLKYGQVPIETIYKDAYKGTVPFDGIKIFFNFLKQKFL